MTPLVVCAFVLLGMLGYAVTIYNGLIRVRNGVKLAWSNIDVLLVQRHDELPKLVEVCKQYMKYEADTLERVMRARAGVEAGGGHAHLKPALGNAARGRVHPADRPSDAAYDGQPNER